MHVHVYLISSENAQLAFISLKEGDCLYIEGQKWL